MEKIYVVDTNALLEFPEILNKQPTVLLSHVIRELEKHKLSHNNELAFKARQATRYIKDNQDKVVFDTKDYTVQDDRLDGNYVDNKIIQACIENDYGLITNDLLLDIKAKGYGVEILDVEKSGSEKDEYKGLHELFLTSSQEDQELLAEIYEIPQLNKFDLVKNQYLFIWNKEKPTYNDDGEQNGYELIDSFKYDGYQLVKLKYKPLNNKFSGGIKPVNEKQKMLFDLLQNKDITIKSCFGKYGVGKDFVMISHALDLIEGGRFDKLIWARNNVELADVPTLGILPGDKVEKLLEFAMPLADHVGGVDGLEMLIRQGKIEIQHLGSLRGRDIKNSIIYVTECQNNTAEHVKLLIGRVGKDSELWLNGDLKQVDKDVYKRNSGILALHKLKGHRLYGQVTLDKTERSETAELAELI